MKRTLSLYAAAALLAASSQVAIAQSDEPIVVPLSDPGRPATLEVSVFQGGVSVTGYDGDEILIMASTAPAEERENTGRNGLRRITNTALGLTAEERDNVVSVEVDRTGRSVQLEISVPRRTSVHARAVHNGIVSIEGVTGEHELSNVNGEISAIDIGGSMVANTTNGDVRVAFADLTPEKAMSFTSFNGNVDVTFPPGLAAALNISAGRGDVLTDFDVVVQPRAPVVERSDTNGRYRVRIEREMRAVVGDGGPEMHFQTFNGDILIRQAD